MSRPPKTDDETPRTSGVPLIARETHDDDVYGGNSIGAAARRNRVFGNPRNKENSVYAASALLGIKNEVNHLFSGFGSSGDAPIDNTTDLLDRIKQVGSFLQSGSFVVALGALKAYDLYSDSKNSILRKSADAPDGARTTKAVAPDAPERSALRTATSVADEAAEAGTKGLFGKALGFLGAGAKLLKRVPLLGAAVTGAFVLYEVGSHVVNGRGTAALGAAFAGAAEIGGNFIGFGVGDGLREGTREAFVRASSAVGYEGAFDAVNKSDIRYLVEAGLELREQFAEAAAPPTVGHSYAPVARYTPSFVAA